MSHRSTPDDILWYILDPKAARAFDKALVMTHEQVCESLQARGYDLAELDTALLKMLEDMPRYAGKRMLAESLVPTAPTPALLVRSSVAEAEPILARVKPPYWSAWPGDETAVGIVVDVFGDVEIEWFPRSTVKRRLSERRASTKDAAVKQACDDTVAALSAPSVPGKVMLCVAAEDRILVPLVRVVDLRVARQLTSFSAGQS